MNNNPLLHKKLLASSSTELSRDPQPPSTPLLPHPLDILQVAQKNLVVHGRPQVPGLEEVHAVQVGDVHPSLVGLRAV